MGSSHPGPLDDLDDAFAHGFESAFRKPVVIENAVRRGEASQQDLAQLDLVEEERPVGSLAVEFLQQRADLADVDQLAHVTVVAVDDKSELAPVSPNRLWCPEPIQNTNLRASERQRLRSRGERS